MDNKNKGLPANFGDSFKALPLVKRIKVLFFARKFLKLQREKKALFEDRGDGDEGGRGNSLCP